MQWRSSVRIEWLVSLGMALGMWQWPSRQWQYGVQGPLLKFGFSVSILQTEAELVMFRILFLKEACKGHPDPSNCGDTLSCKLGNME